MRIKTTVNDLESGMYVAELDRPWKGTSFVFQGFMLTSRDQLDELKKLCSYVFVETNPDAPNQEPPENYSANDDVLPPQTKPGLAKISHYAPERILAKENIETRWRPDKTTLEQELETAKSIEASTREILYTTLEDARLGRSIQVAGVKEVVATMVESVIRNPDAMIVLSQLKNVDEYTALHSLRVCILALTFGRHLDLNRVELNLLGVGALLHDVGKMKVPFEILNKPGKLTDEEFEVMKSHVPEGVKILGSSTGIAAQSIKVAAQHHERYGGKGYVSGLSGDEIGVFGMLSAIVDCYDAITSDRVYHRGMSPYEALTKIYEWRSSDFHPGLIEQFIQCMGIYPIGSIVELTNGSVGVVATVNRDRRLKPKIVLVLNPDKLEYKKKKIIDLAEMEKQYGAGAPDIARVLKTGDYGIDPTDFLPLK